MFKYISQIFGKKWKDFYTKWNICSIMKNKIMNIDHKDDAVIKALRNNARLSTQQLAKQTGIPITTVHNRMKKLRSSGIIKGYTVVLDNKLMGDVVAFVMVSVTYHTQKGKVVDQEELAKKISQNEKVEEVDILAGATDIIVKVRARSVDELNKFVIKYLRSIPGIESTQTLVVLQSI